MATKQIIKPAKSPAAVGPYNHAVRVGDLLFCAGQIPIDPATGELVTGDIVKETEQVFANLAAVLAAAGTDLGRAVKTTVFLTDMGQFGKVNGVYARYFREPFPARSTVQVAALPKGVSVEIDVIAEV